MKQQVDCEVSLSSQHLLSLGLQNNGLPVSGTRVCVCVSMYLCVCYFISVGKISKIVSFLAYHKLLYVIYRYMSVAETVLCRTLILPNYRSTEKNN